MTTSARAESAASVKKTPVSTRRRRSILPERLHVHAFLWVVCLIVTFPVYYSVIVATQTSSEVYRYQFLPGNALADNWNIVMNIANLGQYMLNSVFVTLVVTIGKTILSLLAGLAFVYFRFPGKWIVFGFVLITLMMPTEILILALVRLVNGFGWGSNDSTAYLALTVPFLASATGSFLFRQHFANIPAELSEAAQLDGARPLQFLFYVLVPMSWNTIGALVVIQFIYVWNMYLWPAMAVQGQERQVVQVGLRTLVSSDTGISFGPLMLGAVIASIPPLLVFVVLQKQFMSGFALTRDK
mgnify:CR=1 FL=1